MAEAILAQITMAGGAINLTFNEVLYSYFSDTDNTRTTAVKYSDINNTNWKCVVIWHPQAINPFICFSTSSIFSNAKMINLTGVMPNGNSVYFTNTNNSTTFQLYGGCVITAFA